jgi:hypothetical protein
MTAAIWFFAVIGMITVALMAITTLVGLVLIGLAAIGDRLHRYTTQAYPHPQPRGLLPTRHRPRLLARADPNKG